MIYLFLGMLVGFLSGLLGIGGGILVAPALVFIFEQQALFPHHLTQIAAGSSLAVIIFTSLSSIIAYQQRKSINWELVRQLLPGIVVGALAGTVIATLVSSASLARLLGFLVFLLSIQMLWPQDGERQVALPSSWVLAFFGVLVGFVGGLVGIGGGILLIPFLTYYRVPIRFAAGTVITCTFFVALIGAANLTLLPYILANVKESYIFWPVVWQIVSTSIIFAWVGMLVAHRLPVKILKRIFSVFLAMVGVYLTFLH